MPIRLASLIERCLAKQPADRPASMEEVVAELEAVRADLDAREDGEGTMIMRKPAAVRARRRRRRGRERRRSALAPSPLSDCCCSRLRSEAILLVPRDDGSPRHMPSGGAPVRLQGIASYDPDGDNEEHSGAGRGCDPRRSGHVLDDGELPRLLEARRRPRAGKSEGTPQTLTLTTDTPGFNAEIRGGSSPDGPFDTDVGCRHEDCHPDDDVGAR